MLIKAIRLNLKSTETPINFYNAINNRESVQLGRDGLALDSRTSKFKPDANFWK